MYAVKPTGDYTRQFRELAELILNKTNLKVGGERVRITEIEFYFKTPTSEEKPEFKGDAVHADPYVHCDKEQLTADRWYFHRQNGGGYKGGSFKGVDITCGGKDCYGGILIRGLAELDGTPIANGPALSVNWMLKQFGFRDVNELSKTFSVVPERVNHEASLITLEPASKPRDDRILKSERVGLNFVKAKDDRRAPCIEYIARPYRYTSMPTECKWKHGFGLELYRRGFRDPKKLEGIKTEMKELLAVGNRHIRNWIDNFHKGLDFYEIDSFFRDKRQSMRQVAVCCQFLGWQEKDKNGPYEPETNE